MVEFKILWTSWYQWDMVFQPFVCGVGESNGDTPIVNQNIVTSISDQTHMLHYYILFPEFPYL